MRVKVHPTLIRKCLSKSVIHTSDNSQWNKFTINNLLKNDLLRPNGSTKQEEKTKDIDQHTKTQYPPHFFSLLLAITKPCTSFFLSIKIHFSKKKRCQEDIKIRLLCRENGYYLFSFFNLFIVRKTKIWQNQMCLRWSWLPTRGSRKVSKCPARHNVGGGRQILVVGGGELNIVGNVDRMIMFFNWANPSIWLLVTHKIIIKIMFIIVDVS